MNFGHELLKNSVSDVCKDAKENNIERILSINSNIYEFQRDINLIKGFNFVDITLGHHPNNTLDIKPEEIKNLLNENIKKFKDRIVGIGETGLDYHYDIPKNKQIESLEIHLDAASVYNLPCIIHMRDAEEDMIEIIEKEFKKTAFSGVIHCFTGSLSFAEKLLKIGFYFSVSGIITFKNSNELRDTVSNIPMNKIMIETDSPYLSPVPVRGTVNQPANILHTLEYMSKLYNVDLENFRDISTNNFFNLFKKAI